MRKSTIAAILVTAGISAAASAAAPTKINIQGVLREAPAGPIYLHVSAGDLDGDGLADEAFVRLVCADGMVKQAAYSVKAPRDSASGMASGKRTHKPVTFVKEWGPSTPQLRAITPTYDVKKVEGARAKTMAEDSWTPISLSNADGLCDAAAAAAKVVTKTSSNIQNN
jgi:hypothetical protein